MRISNAEFQLRAVGIIFLVFLIVGPICFGAMYLRGRIMYNEIKDNPQVYVYDTLFGSLRFAQFIENKRYSKAFIRYYKLAEQQVLHYDTLGFPPQFLPVDVPVYLRNPEDLYGDSPLVEVIDLDSCSLTYSYTKCYIYRATMHINPPSDSVLEEFYKNLQRRSDSLKIPSKYFKE